MATDPNDGDPVPEASIRAVNLPFDAPSIFADTVQGVMISPQVVKIFFLEHLVPFEDQTLRGRYVANLVMPAPQLRAMGELFVRLANEHGGAIVEPNE